MRTSFRPRLVKRFFQERVKLRRGHAATMELGMHRRENVLESKLSQRQPRLHGFDDERADVFARRRRLGTKLLVGCRWQVDGDRHG